MRGRNIMWLYNVITYTRKMCEFLCMAINAYYMMLLYVFCVFDIVVDIEGVSPRLSKCQKQFKRRKRTKCVIINTCL